MYCKNVEGATLVIEYFFIIACSQVTLALYRRQFSSHLTYNPRLLMRFASMSRFHKLFYLKVSIIYGQIFTVIHKKWQNTKNLTYGRLAINYNEDDVVQHTAGLQILLQ